MNRLHTPILFRFLFRKGPKPSRPHTLFLSVRGSWTDCLQFLLLFPVLSWRAPRTNCLYPWFPLRRSSWTSCLHFLFLSLRGARTHFLRLLCLGGSAADLHSLAKGPSGLCNARLGSSDFRIAPLSYTVGSPGPAASHQTASSCVTILQTARSVVAVHLNSGSPGDSLRAICLNSGSARDGLLAVHLNSGSAGDGLWAVPTRPEFLPSFRGPLHPPWLDVCFGFVLWASRIRP
ncbi:hypothetical protein ATANTOWER_021863 [Ataeniobius toweri]|uniref:Uncharacterized protein n=1 Tax=Ataeniobius toweri TaxID=208326 RepID=A0ABU7A7K5_9TELE|nr:hypothetical protein [Ataeniobius toweri]